MSASASPLPGQLHTRQWQGGRYIYPVVSRRAGGLSIGINLNVDKVCNFGCVYCEVQRGVLPLTRTVDVEALAAELAALLEQVRRGEVQRHPALGGSDEQPLRLADIAFSGDGEPTSFRNFLDVMRRVLALRDAAGVECPVVVITNASLLHRPAVREALALLHSAGGEVWAKLDAGTAEYFRLVDATPLPFERILRNLLDLGRRQPIVIQTCLMELHGEGPSDAEIGAYIERLRELLAGGAHISLVQLYSVARPPAERYVRALPPPRLEAIRARVAAALPPEIPVRRYDGTWTGPAEEP